MVCLHVTDHLGNRVLTVYVVVAGNDAQEILNVKRK